MTFEEYCDSQCYESHGYDFRHAEVGWAARSTIADVPEINLNNYFNSDVEESEQAKGQMFAAWNRLKSVGGKAVS